MTAILWSDEAETRMDADADVVWALLSDVTRMGQWSPVCRRCEWAPGSNAPSVGARFVGHSRQAGARWSRECVITACEPGREFAFHTLFRSAEGTRWRYRLEPDGHTTRVVESYEVVAVPRWVRTLRRLPGMASRSKRDTRRGMQRTLDRIKSAAESGHDTT